MVIGSALHHVTIRIRRLEKATWMAIRTACAGRIGSLLELRQGRVPDDIAEVVTDRGSGLFPQPDDIVASCECEDGTTMCKHAAAVLSGIGSRLDESPELVFLPRRADETELTAAEAARSRDAVTAGGLEPCGTRGEVASKEADSRPPNALGAAESTESLSAPTSTDSAAPSRQVKKTLTYRPPAPTDARRRPAPTDLTVEVAGFVPTGEMVADLREQCECSVAEFAELIQVTPTTVRRWEAAPGAVNLHVRRHAAGDPSSRRPGFPCEPACYRSGLTSWRATSIGAPSQRLPSMRISSSFRVSSTVTTVPVMPSRSDGQTTRTRDPTGTAAPTVLNTVIGFRRPFSRDILCNAIAVADATQTSATPSTETVEMLLKRRPHARLPANETRPHQRFAPSIVQGFTSPHKALTRR